MRILNIPGYGGSGKDHWQSHWDNEFKNIERIEQDNWDNPQLDLWLERLNQSIQESQHDCILVAHSLGCALIAHWASKHSTNTALNNIVGALLVAPADVDSEKHTPEEVRNFAPMPTATLPFKSIVVASDNDPYVSVERAEYFAKAWGSEFIQFGSYGHINAESKLSSWDFGKDLLKGLIL
jgi:predicted alpha/beta hydrolase family esterase